MRVLAPLLVSLVALATAQAGAASAADLTLKGLKGEARTISEAELRAMPHLPATSDNEGRKTAYEGVKVASLLSLVGFTPQEQLRGPALATVVLFTASDGYVVALTLADLDVDFRDGNVVVADAKGGQPLDAKEGPFRLVVEGDKRAARSVRNLAGIELRNVR
jgi:hypothetical protein